MECPYVSYTCPYWKGQIKVPQPHHTYLTPAESHFMLMMNISKKPHWSSVGSSGLRLLAHLPRPAPPRPRWCPCSSPCRSTPTPTTTPPGEGAASRSEQQSLARDASNPWQKDKNKQKQSLETLQIPLQKDKNKQKQSLAGDSSDPLQKDKHKRDRFKSLATREEL